MWFYILSLLFFFSPISAIFNCSESVFNLTCADVACKNDLCVSPANGYEGLALCDINGCCKCYWTSCRGCVPSGFDNCKDYCESAFHTQGDCLNSTSLNPSLCCSCTSSNGTPSFKIHLEVWFVFMMVVCIVLRVDH